MTTGFLSWHFGRLVASSTALVGRVVRDYYGFHVQLFRGFAHWSSVCQAVPGVGGMPRYRRDFETAQLHVMSTKLPSIEASE
jgi:hypothetical protein